MHGEILCRDGTLQNTSTLSDRLDERLFRTLYATSLVYNTCWEDPAVDRQAVNLRPDDVLLVITSAGCNALDYALLAPKRIHAVDANPRQTALLELKLAAVRGLEFDDFFSVFGDGFHPEFRDLYGRRLRGQLSDFARDYWDRRLDWFASKRGSFYFHGLSGLVACAFKGYLALRPRLAAHVRALFGASSLEEQRTIYDERVAPEMWGPTMRWALSRQFTLSLLGVPHPQRREIEAQHAGGVAGYVRESLEYVLRQLPIWSNYFWRLYLHGRYTHSCCPEYLREENFALLKGGLVDRIVPHTSTVTDFLRGSDEQISKFVLLDHMDWMASHYPQALVEEWREILAHAAPRARVIFRSAHARPHYLETICVDGVRLTEHLSFHENLARELTRQDRVHTYAGFHICDVPA
ncbi:MAG: S-adenosylmethionine:diacylglycerol 3-amino-3-carboxypropyl transferase [Gammaproteobacteria bacterium]|nr:S-adenosylmethionine:diacylglycerol 3-amino-3-carboxypropyl transferase [Gammaproteobacteria bacterium]